MAQSLHSHAEQEALKCLDFSFCNQLNLASIKERIATMLNHIGENGMFAEYTMHDITHVNGMLALLDQIIPDTTRYDMTSADWLMIVLAIYFHDLGMHIPFGEYENRNCSPNFCSMKEKMLDNKEIKQYVESLPGEGGEKFLYQEYVRRNHGQRVYDWILNRDRRNEEPYMMIDEMLSGLDNSFRKDLALVCRSHQQDELPEQLQAADKAYGADVQERVNLLYSCILLRSSDILHLTHERTPEDEYRIISPKNEISVIEWAKQRAIRSVYVRKEKDEQGNVDSSIQPFAFEVQGEFSDDNGYFSFLSQINYVNEELKRCHKWCEDSRKRNANSYFFPWMLVDTSRVGAEGFEKKKLRFEIDQKNILKLLTGHTLYNDSTVVLRELIQNSMDAGRLQSAMSKASSSYRCKIEISWDSASRILRVADNATGMDRVSISNYLLKVGASKYQSDSFKKDFPKFHSISRFGIGLLTCFMICDDVDIYTLDAFENQCLLLKIRNLTGEYLMRNDADTSKILDGKHGTTFELKVRKDIPMDKIERQIRQWVMIPFGDVTLSIDNHEPIKIGYNDVAGAVTAYASNLKDVDLQSGKNKVFSMEEDGVQMAFLMVQNPVTNMWTLYNYDESDIEVDAPIGICVHGIRVTDFTPGLRNRDYLVLANCTGEDAPTTNVARNALEDNENLERVYRIMYKIFTKMYVDQANDILAHDSVTWAARQVNNSLGAFYSERYFSRFDRREIFEEQLKNTPCIVVDNGKSIQIKDLNSIPENVATLESMAFNSAVTLLQDIPNASKTAYGLLAELENTKPQDEIILYDTFMARCLYNLFLGQFEVVAIQCHEDIRRIKFIWARNCQRWMHIKAESPYSHDPHLYILQEPDSVTIEGLNDKFVVVSGDKVMLAKESRLLKFMNGLLNANLLNDKALEAIADLICRFCMNRMSYEDGNLEHFLDTEFDSEEYDFGLDFDKHELFVALQECKDKILNIQYYYNNLND